MKQTKKHFMPILSSIVLSILLSVSITANAKTTTYNLDNIPEYSGEAAVQLNDNVPEFSEKMIKDAKGKTYESYAKLDSLGRCGVCVASIDQSLMPTEERGNIGQVKPTGWHTVKYSEQIDGNYLYNRCHLIGYQLTGENANKKNLITGTRYLNVDGMLPYEDTVADYLKKNSSNKVLYRVTPVFADKDDLVCSGVQMEALSLNDNGKAIQFNVYCYNVQPGIDIDYADGSSKLNANWKSIIANAKGESVKGSSSTTVTAKKTTTKATTKKQESQTTQPKAEEPKAEQPKTEESNIETQKVEQPVAEQPAVSEAPAVEQQPATPPATGNDTTAWLSATGSKYHSINNCGRMNPDKATQTTVSAAEAAGYERCSKCW